MLHLHNAVVNSNLALLFNLVKFYSNDTSLIFLLEGIFLSQEIPQIS